MGAHLCSPSINPCSTPRCMRALVMRACRSPSSSTMATTGVKRWQAALISRTVMVHVLLWGALEPPWGCGLLAPFAPALSGLVRVPGAALFGVELHLHVMDVAKALALALRLGGLRGPTL